MQILPGSKTNLEKELAAEEGMDRLAGRLEWEWFGLVRRARKKLVKVFAVGLVVGMFRGRWGMRDGAWKVFRKKW